MRYVWGYKQPFWQLLQSICLSACLSVSPKQHSSVHLLSTIDFGTFHLFHHQSFLNGGCGCSVSHGEDGIFQKELKIEREKGFIGANRPFLIKIGTAFAMWIWSIYACHTASRSNDYRTLEHHTSDQNPYKVAGTIHSCWRSLSSCNSMLAHRVLMAAAVQPRRLAEHTPITAASPQPNTSHWDISLTTSSMQRCEMLPFLPQFLFMIVVCGGAIIDMEGKSTLALVWALAYLPQEKP